MSAENEAIVRRFLDAFCIHRIADGKITEEWTPWDALGLLQQFGALPEPAAA